LAITREKKEELVEGYVDLLKNSQAVVFIRLQGLSVAEVTDLRSRVRDVGGSYSVIKNTLFKLALTQVDKPVPDLLNGPISATFCPEDFASVVRVINEFARGMGDREFGIVGGIIEQETLDATAAKALASLPSKEMLFAQILAGINAPGTQLAGVVASGIRNVLNVLQARVDQLQEGEAAA
jgi:large subunit ribosomal protein L10